jgi:GT2 family glycosyltransferase
LKEKKLVVIIILNYDNKPDTLVSLESVSKLEYSPFEIVLVDNGSRDDSVEEIKRKYPDVHLIESKTNLGVAGGRNLGIRYSNENFDYSFLFFLDNDIAIKPDALSQMVSSFDSEEKVGIVSPKCYVENTNVIKYAGGMSINFFTGLITDIGGGQEDDGQFDEFKFIPASGGLCLVSRIVINEIKSFDERFNPYGWEDIDFSIRTVKAGFKVFYNYKAVIYHKGGKIGRGKKIDEYEYSKLKNYFTLIRKHANIFQLLTIFLILPFRVLSITAKEILNRKAGDVFSPIRGFYRLNRNDNEYR